MKTYGNEDLKNIVKKWIQAYETRNKDLVKEIFSDSSESFH